MKLIAAALCTATALCAATAANAGAIIAPTSGVIDVGGPGFGNLADTFNQAGLLTGYTPGVTDFDTYIAGNPQEDFVFANHEWFSNQNTDSAQVTFDFGSVVTIDAFALWNEDASGVGHFVLSGDADPSFLAGDPVNNLLNNNYGPQVFTFDHAVTTRFVTLAMSRCPQPPDASFNACAIGEVAFREATGGGVPEPSSWALMILGFGAGGAMLRRRRHAILA
jgi:hypothetical protein